MISWAHQTAGIATPLQDYGAHGAPYDRAVRSLDEAVSHPGGVMFAWHCSPDEVKRSSGLRDCVCSWSGLFLV